VFSQLEFTKNKRLLFVGADNIEGKRIISGVYVTPKDSFHLEVRLDILDDWVQKDSVYFLVEIDTSSIFSENYTIELDGKTLPAYRFQNPEGFELIIEKERKFTYTPLNSSNEVIGYQSDLVKVILPKNKDYYVKSLPLMFNK